MDRTGGEVVARGRAAYEAEGNSALLFFLTAQGVPRRREIITSEGTGIVSYFSIFRCHSFFIVFAVWCRAVLSLSYMQKKKYVRTCMRHPGCFPGWSMELLALASRLFAPNCLDCLIPSILPIERAWRRNRPRRELPCIF